MRPTRTQLAELRRKYHSLRELRRTVSEAPARQLRQLAEQFPGALRELDTLPIELIEERLAQCDRALAVGELEAWIVWMHAYHEAMRAALKLKPRLRRIRSPSAEHSAELARWLTDTTGTTWDASFVRSVAAPPFGRLNPVILRRVAEHFQVTPHILAATLFPGRPVRAF